MPTPPWRSVSQTDGSFLQVEIKGGVGRLEKPRPETAALRREDRRAPAAQLQAQLFPPSPAVAGRVSQGLTQAITEGLVQQLG